MLQEYIQRFIGLIIDATGTHPTSVTCQVTIVVFIRHLLNKGIKRQGTGAKTTQTLKHAMTLFQEVKTKPKKYEGLNADDPSVIQISSIPHSEELAVQWQNCQLGNTQNMNQAQDATVSNQASLCNIMVSACTSIESFNQHMF